VLHGKLQKLKLFRFNNFKCCFEAFAGYRCFSFHQSLKCFNCEAFEAFVKLLKLFISTHFGKLQFEALIEALWKCSFAQHGFTFGICNVNDVMQATSY
jgi:hypothetical protein